MAQGLDPLAIGCGQRADGPVAAEDDAISAKLVEHVVDDRRQVIGCPGSRGGRGNDARDLAHHILPLGEPADIGFPAREVLGSDTGVAAVVEDERGVGASIDQLGHIPEIVGPHAQIEAQA